MPTKFSTSWTYEQSKRGPKNIAGINRGQQRVEGTASEALNAMATSFLGISPAVLIAAEQIVQDYTKDHNKQAETLARSNFGGSPRATGIRKSFDTEFEKGAHSVTGRSVNRARYAIFQEYGFHHWRNGAWVDSRPFMFPTYAALKEGFKSAMRGLFK